MADKKHTGKNVLQGVKTVGERELCREEIGNKRKVRNMNHNLQLQRVGSKGKAGLKKENGAAEKIRRGKKK